MTTAEAGRLLQIHANQVLRHIRAGRLRATVTQKGRQQHTYEITTEALEAFRQAHRGRTRSQIATEMWAKRKAILAPEPTPSINFQLLAEDQAEELARRQRLLAGTAREGDVEAVRDRQVALWWNRNTGNLIGDVRQSAVGHLVGA